MRPITVLNGILFGSCVALFLGTSVTLLIFLIIGPETPSIKAELGSLSMYAGIFLGMMLLSGGSFYGHLRKRAWRWWSQAFTLAGLAGSILYLLP